MNPEDVIPYGEKLKEGIFFTSPDMVRKIVGRLDLSRFSRIIDTAAGSGNFLIPLARKYPQKQFYGIEKDERIFRYAAEHSKALPNLTWYRGDMLFDSFSIPPCDLYLGNPPFINLNDLEDGYRQAVITLWKEYFATEKGYRLLLGSSRGDLAQLVFRHTLERFLTPGASCAVILPESLIFGNEASRDFRRFRGLEVMELRDISQDAPFAHTERNCFVIYARRGGITEFPLSYIRKDGTVPLHRHRDQLVPEDAIITGDNPYRARQGINTLGANKIFMFNDRPEWKTDLLRPLFRSSDVKAWRANPSRWVLMPYEGRNLIPEERLMESEPDVWAYLNRHRPLLEGRKSPHLKKRPWYSLFGVGDYTFAPFKVIWQALGALKLRAAVTEDGIPNQAMHGYIGLQSRQEAHFICALLNSSPLDFLVGRYSLPGAKSFAQPGTLSRIPLPLFDRNNETHQRLAELSMERHRGAVPAKETEINYLVREFLPYGGD